MIVYMVILDATVDTLALDLMERSRYGFRSLAEAVEKKDSGEELVGRDVLEKAGFIVEPFWGVAGDLEGDAYHSYIDEHPAFDFAVRRGVYARLLRAQAKLPDSWRLVLRAGFRPFDVQLRLLDIFMEKSRTDMPERTDAQHLEHARTFVSDPRLVCPPHVTGGAVDVDVKNLETGEYVDMGCLPNTDSEISFLHSDLLTSQQYDNRMVLLDAMLSAGFAPNPHEWWHYQYGETYWAAFYGYSQTLYDKL